MMNKINKKLWWILLPAVIVAGTITTVLLVLPKAPGISKNSRYSKEELFAMEQQIENAFEVAAKDNYGYVETANNYLSTEQSDFLNSVDGLKCEFDDKFSTLMEHSDTFEDRLEIANALEEEAKENDLSICSWEKVEEQKYGIMQDYIKENLAAIQEKDSDQISDQDKADFREKTYEKATALGQTIDELAEKNESLTEFLLKTDDSNILKQYMSKVNTNLFNESNDFEQRFQTKLQTRASYAFEDVNKSLRITQENGAPAFDLGQVLTSEKLDGNVVFYDDNSESDSSTKDYKYIKEDSTTGAIPYFQWNYKYWDSNIEWSDENNNQYVGYYAYDWKVFNGTPLSSGEDTRYPILGSNPAISHYKIRLAVKTDGDNLAYDFDNTNCTATYHLNVIIVDTEHTFEVTNEGGSTDEYNYMKTYPIDFTQPASRLQIRKYLIDHNKDPDVLNINQDDETGEGTSIANTVNTYKSLGVFFDKKAFDGTQENDGDNLLFTPFIEKYDPTGDGDYQEIVSGTILDQKDTDAFYRVKLNFHDTAADSFWSTKIFNYILEDNSEPVYDIDGKQITENSKSACVTISTLNKVLAAIDYVKGVSDEEYQGLQVVAKIMSIVPYNRGTNGTPLDYNVNTQLFVRVAKFESSLPTGDSTDQTSKYEYAEYPLLAANYNPDNGGGAADNFDDDWSQVNYDQYYEGHKTDNAFDNIVIPLHYTDKEKAWLNYCDNFEASYDKFQRLSKLALSLDSIGDKFYHIYDIHAPLLPLYITSMVAMCLAVIVDGLLLVNYILGLPYTIGMCILQGIIVAADIVFLVLVSIQLDNAIYENKAYNAVKGAWDEFLPAYKQELPTFQNKYKIVNEKYQAWLKTPSNATKAGELYDSSIDYYSYAVDEADTGETIHHNVNYLFEKIFNALKEFADEDTKKQTYVGINIHTDLENVMGKIGDGEEMVYQPFNSTNDKVLAIFSTITETLISIVSVSISATIQGIIYIAICRVKFNALPAPVRALPGLVPAPQIVSPYYSQMSKMVQTTPFSIARAIVLVILVAVGIAIAVLEFMVSDLTDEFVASV